MSKVIANNEHLTGVHAEIAEIYLSKKQKLSFREACLILNLTPEHLKQLTQSGAIPCYRKRGWTYYKVKDMVIWGWANPDHDRSNVLEMFFEYMIAKAISSNKKEFEFYVEGIGNLVFQFDDEVKEQQ